MKITKKSDSGNICQATNQFVELHIEHQIFDIIYTAGSDGITIKEVNAYDSLRIVDALYHHKYFLTAFSGLHLDVRPSSNKTIKKIDNTCSLSASADVLGERN